MHISYTLNEINDTAAQLWQQYRHKKVWAFYAPMGAGKTTLIHAICNHLKITGPVSSPTFAIIKEYYSPAAGIVYHMDWYRLKGEEEAIQAGAEDCLYKDAYCFIEWPEKAESILPPETLKIHIEAGGEKKRTVITQE